MNREVFSEPFIDMQMFSVTCESQTCSSTPECFSTYRYGFNGKEKIDEVNGSSGATYDYGFRIYDARLGRFLSVDPLTKDYPELTPYQFASNRPIDGMDMDGLEYTSAAKWVKVNMADYSIGFDYDQTGSHT